MLDGFFVFRSFWQNTLVLCWYTSFSTCAHPSSMVRRQLVNQELWHPSMFSLSLLTSSFCLYSVFDLMAKYSWIQLMAKSGPVTWSLFGRLPLDLFFQWCNVNQIWGH